MAVICWVFPTVTLADVGVMAIAVNAGAVTVKVAVLEVMPLRVAVILLAPCARVLAVPPVIVATAVLLDAQITEPVTFPVLPFE